MTTEDDDLPLLPGFREMAQRALLDDLVARRRELGISQGEVAARMGTSQPAVARLEAGGVDARLSTLTALRGRSRSQDPIRNIVR